MFATLYAALTIEVLPASYQQGHRPWHDAQAFQRELFRRDDPWHLLQVVVYPDLAALQGERSSHKALTISRAESRYVPSELGCSEKRYQFIRLLFSLNEDFDLEAWQFANHTESNYRVGDAQDLLEMLLYQERSDDPWCFTRAQLYPTAHALLAEHMLTQALAG